MNSSYLGKSTFIAADSGMSDQPAGGNVSTKDNNFQTYMQVVRECKAVATLVARVCAAQRHVSAGTAGLILT